MLYLSWAICQPAVWTVVSLAYFWAVKKHTLFWHSLLRGGNCITHCLTFSSDPLISLPLYTKQIPQQPLLWPTPITALHTLFYCNLNFMRCMLGSVLNCAKKKYDTHLLTTFPSLCGQNVLYFAIITVKPFLTFYFFKKMVMVLAFVLKKLNKKFLKIIQAFKCKWIKRLSGSWKAWIQ